MKKLIYPTCSILIALLLTYFTRGLHLDYFLSNLFMVNLPFFCISVALYSIEKGMWNFSRYSWKRFSLFNHEKKIQKLMLETRTNSKEAMDEALREKYLYQTPSFRLSEYLVLPSSLLFFCILLYLFFTV